jgi:hypothetical protein
MQKYFNFKKKNFFIKNIIYFTNKLDFPIAKNSEKTKFHLKDNFLKNYF